MTLVIATEQEAEGRWIAEVSVLSTNELTMFRVAPRCQSPVHQALWSTGLMVVLGLVVRFVWGAFDPEMRTWTFVALAPFMGAFMYLQATRRHRLIGVGLIVLSLGALLLYASVLMSGAKPITSRADYAYITLILLIPVGGVALGWSMLRRLRASSPSDTA